MKTARAWLVATAAVVAMSAAHAEKVRLATSMGDIVVDLDRAKAPATVENFVQYVKAGHYDGTVFHRVIDGFMIQGGGMTSDMAEKPTRAPIALESRNGLTNVRGSIAMARTMDPNSATAQFFINVKDNPPLDAANSRDGNPRAPCQRAGRARRHSQGNRGEVRWPSTCRSRPASATSASSSTT
jgi:peptidyl-prolyl cis-trans isomerase A (cyclophilin A)